jgi:hypothetical protein
VANDLHPRADSRDPVVEAYKSGIDRTLIRKNLALTTEQRFIQLMELIRLAEELRAAGRKDVKR